MSQHSSWSMVDFVNVSGAQCVLVKNCVLRDTKAGEIAVVVNHSQPSNGVSELFTLMIFYQSASSAALTVSQFFDITEPTALDTQKRDRAVARAKLTTPPLNIRIS